MTCRHSEIGFLASSLRSGHWTDHRSAAIVVVMRILVTGDRFWTCPKLASSIVRRLVARYGPGVTIVHGGSPGVDDSFSSACWALDINTEPHLADWKGLGSIAGPLRNKGMVDSGADL